MNGASPRVEAEVLIPASGLPHQWASPLAVPCCSLSPAILASLPFPEHPTRALASVSSHLWPVCLETLPLGGPHGSHPFVEKLPACVLWTPHLPALVL